MCQAANIGSLEHVVQKFRDAAEEKVAEAQKALEGKTAGMADLDENESPETILLRSIQASDTRSQSQDRDVHIHYRFLWDAYKVVLDVLKSNAKMEECYHETARHAFTFCQAHTRPQEFKRLCDTLRKNYGDLHKNTGKTGQHQVNPNNADTIMRTLETRCRQLQISTELDLWRESYLTATEIFELMSKARPKPHLRSMYYEYLGQIFWKSDNHLFHAFACLKNLMFVKAAKQNLCKDELQLLASKAVLATLCVPFQKNSDIHATLELTTEGASSPYEKAKKHATLFNVQSVPTRESISQQLVEKGLLSLAEELSTSFFTPGSRCTSPAAPLGSAYAEYERLLRAERHTAFLLRPEESLREPARATGFEPPASVQWLRETVHGYAAICRAEPTGVAARDALLHMLCAQHFVAFEIASRIPAPPPAGTTPPGCSRGFTRWFQKSGSS